MNADDVAVVVELACGVEDRTADEQRALLRVALAVDRERGRWTVMNPRPVRPYLTGVALHSARPARPVMTRAQRKTWENLLGRWKLCACGKPGGAHDPGMCRA